MNCLEFERLLDAGEPARLPAAAAAHAHECARCERALRRARSLELSLERHFARAGSALLDCGDDLATAEVSVVRGELPTSFTDRVMERVERSEARGVRWLTLPDAMPWWVRVPAEPSVALAMALAALLLWRGEAFLAVARAWAPGLASASVRWGETVNGLHFAAPLHTLLNAFMPGPASHWSVIAAMTLGIAPLVALASYALWRLGERLAEMPGNAVLR